MAAFDQLAVRPGLSPMEAKLVDMLPDGGGWQFEPKWDGFRCLVFRDGDDVELQSKSGKPLARYFPEMVAAVRACSARQFALDGELIVPVGERLDFAALQMRLHPVESRIRKLARETPAQLMVFDCLATQAGESLAETPLAGRREALERLHASERSPSILLSPYTEDGEEAKRWLARAGGALDGVVVKRRDAPYRPGERTMLKIKQQRTADCVVGGFRYATKDRLIGSLLLGLYGQDGRLHHVGFTSALPGAERPVLTARLEAMVQEPGFTGDAPGGPSRWSTERSADWYPLRPALVVEVRYDQVTGNRFRHGTKLLRWRPDKAPEQCRLDQLEYEVRPAELAATLGGGL